MNASELATRMLEWEKAKHALDDLTAEIQSAVLELAQTQTVGNVRASYRKGHRSYDYKAAIEAASLEPGSLGPFEIIRVDYRSACKEFGIAEIPFTESPPSVSVRLLVDGG